MVYEDLLHRCRSEKHITEGNSPGSSAVTTTYCPPEGRLVCTERERGRMLGEVFRELLCFYFFVKAPFKFSFMRTKTALKSGVIYFFLFTVEEFQ